MHKFQILLSMATILIQTCSFDYYNLKFAQLNSVPAGSENLVDQSFPDFEIFIKWTNWSCCSACCCPKAVCKQFATSGDSCSSLKSVQYRNGEIMIRKTGNSQNDWLDDLLGDKNEVMYSKAIDKSSGIEKELNTAKTSLLGKMKISSDTMTVFQTRDCKDNIQKLDCWELAKCLFNSTEMLPEKKVAHIEESDVCENASIFILRDAYNILSLEPEKLYRIQIDKKIGGSIINANFTFQGEPVEKLKHVKDCAHQPKRIFQHPNGVDLIVRLDEESLSKNPKITALITYQKISPLEITVDLVLKTKAKKLTENSEEDSWFSIVLISALAICSLILLGLSLFFLR